MATNIVLAGSTALVLKYVLLTMAVDMYVLKVRYIVTQKTPFRCVHTLTYFCGHKSGTHQPS